MLPSFPPGYVGFVMTIVMLVLVSGCKRPQTGASVIECAASGCPQDDRRAIEGGVVRVHADAEPAGLCDLVNHEAWVRWIVENQVMETLIEQAPDGTLSPRLATQWSWSRHGELLLSLRSDAHFHDGRPFTARDVVWTLERARDRQLGADQASDFDAVGSIAEWDDHHVVLELKKPAPFLLQALAHIAMYPHMDGVDLRMAQFCRAPVGTGPFRFASWESGRTLTLARNDAYWGTHAHLQRVEFRFVRDRSAARLLYDRGELDVMALPPERAVSLPAGHRVYRYTPHAFFFALWNTQRVRDPATRVALAQLFDLPRFIDIAFARHARPQSGPFVQGSPSYDERILPWPYDLRAARTGTLPEKLTFLAVAGSQSSEKLATLLEEDLRRAGVQLVIEKLDFAQLLERLRKHDFDVTALQLSLAIEQDNYGLFHSGAEQNWGALRDPQIDALLERIAVTDDADARHVLDRQLHAALHERGPMTFLAAPEVAVAVAPGVGGVRPSTDGFDLAHAFRIAP